MLDASSHGRVAPKSKSINVEANLLSQRIEERTSIRSEIRKRLAIASIALLIVLIGFPPVYRFHSAETKAYKEVADRDKLLAAQLETLKKTQEQLQPILNDQNLFKSIKSHGNEVLGQLVLFLNNASPHLSLTSISTTVKDGKIEIAANAMATSYMVAADFIKESAKGPNSDGTELGTMGNNPVLGPEGVTFNLTKKIRVSK